MVRSIEQARQEVQQAFEAALAVADAGEKRSFCAFEGKQWSLLLELGRSLTVLFIARQVERPRATEYTHGGGRYRVDGERTSELGSGAAHGGRRGRAGAGASRAGGSTRGRRRDPLNPSLMVRALR